MVEAEALVLLEEMELVMKAEVEDLVGLVAQDVNRQLQELPLITLAEEAAELTVVQWAVDQVVQVAVVTVSMLEALQQIVAVL